jgi:hypothetical protein
MMATAGQLSVDARLGRFRSVHWYQPKSKHEIVSLERGMGVDVGESGAKEVLRCAEGLAAYLRYRQTPDGSFAYEYEPATDGYTKGEGEAHEAGAAWALGRVGLGGIPGLGGGAASLAASQLAILRHQGMLRSLPDAMAARYVGARYVGTGDGRHPLGASARLLLALNLHSDASQWESLRAGLWAAILWTQTEDGGFVSVFPPSRRAEESMSHAGMALLALAEVYRRDPSSDVLDAYNKAFERYSVDWRAEPTLDRAAWLSRAFARMGVVSNRRAFARLGFDMADWMLERQLGEVDGDRQLVGGVGVGAAPPDVSTGVCLSAFCHAAAAARYFGDEDRANRYEGAARAAGRFVIQLQFREEEAFYLRFPRDVVGGVRLSPTDNRLRLEGQTYALNGLLDYLELVLLTGSDR